VVNATEPGCPILILSTAKEKGGTTNFHNTMSS
jgi:hypothetical protein